VAPGTMQWATFEEYRSADAWAIVDGELFYIKD
jgi:hypothetical protein